MGGARAIFRPKTARAEAILQDPQHPEFEVILAPLFSKIGALLESLRGRIKLTPDFGRFASVSDFLARYTEHVLGIACPAGGCGGKASYTTTGIIAALQVFAPEAPNDGSLTIIGSDGALGRDLVRHFRVIAPRAELVVCDLAYDSGTSAPPDGLAVLPAEPGRFTRDCLGRGGTIIATTVGGELEASDLDVLGSGALLVLAHNLATPEGVKGVKLMRAVAERRVTAIPGPLLTLGGALTSRLEWFSRKARPGRPFDDARKALAIVSSGPCPATSP